MDNYYINKEARAKRAQEHTQEMYDKYMDEIYYSINNSTIYGYNNKFPKIFNESMNNPTIVVCALDSVVAAKSYKSGKTAILNFASYKNPGGNFYGGSSAQEESLCHESFLYNVLKSFEKTYYEPNRNNLNKGLYTNKAIYSPDVFFGEDKFDVITCAAPNIGVGRKYQNVSDAQNSKILDSRIKFILDIAAENKVDTLILGAFGCGVFKQNPIEVAGKFKYYINQYDFKNVIFAVPYSENNNNLKCFQKEFNNDITQV